MPPPSGSASARWTWWDPRSGISASPWSTGARSVNITVRAKRPELITDAIEQTRQILRRERGVKPGEADNFDFFNSASLITEFNRMSVGVKIAGFVIGIVALVVAGIGIMNIM